MTAPIKRILEFVNKKGGIPLVSKRAGLTPSVFNNYNNPARKNENVGGEVHAKMKCAFPDEYSADYIITGNDEIGELRKKLAIETFEKSRMQEFYIKKEMDLSNFNETFSEDQFVDNLENLEALKDECFKTRLIGNSYYKDLSGKA